MNIPNPRFVTVGSTQAAAEARGVAPRTFFQWMQAGRETYHARAFLRNPGERRRLPDDLSLIGSAVEEFLRYDSPVQTTDRVAMVDCEIAGHPVRRGTVVAPLLGVANRDPARFAEPDRLDIGRLDDHHVSFGHGAHSCLGAALARVEAQIAIATLLRRFADFDGDQHRKDWKQSVILCGPTILWLWW